MTPSSAFAYKCDWFNRLAQYIILFAFASIPLCALFVAAYYCLFYPNNFCFNDVPLWLGSLVIPVAIILSLRHRITLQRHRLLLVMAFVLGNIGMLVSLFSFDTQPASDYKAIYSMAQHMASEDFDLTSSPYFGYFELFRFQTGIAAFESVVFRIFGVGMLPLQIINILLINAAFFLTYRLTRRKAGRDVAVIALLLMCTYYPILVTVNQFSNQHVACVLILVSLLILDRYDKWYAWAGVGVLMGLTNVIRPLGILLLLTACVYAVYVAFARRRYVILLSFVALVLPYQAVVFGFDQLFVSKGYALGPVSQQKYPYYKFEMGLLGNYEWKSEINRFGDDTEAFNHYQKDKIVDAVVHRSPTVIAYVANKMVRYLGEMDWKVVHTYNHDNAIHESQPVRGWIIFGWAQYIIIGVLALLGYCQWRRRHPLDVFQIFYVGNFMVYFLIEAFSSYRYEGYPIMMMFAACGLYNILAKKSIIS